MSGQKTISQEGLVDKMRDFYEEQLTRLHTQMIAMGSLCEKAIADAEQAAREYLEACRAARAGTEA